MAEGFIPLRSFFSVRLLVDDSKSGLEYTFLVTLHSVRTLRA